ncbi:hypothetical protein HDU67_006200 [Dinochytrium kinnereticum]|nr:hypothetical protein HDU67_006200 [Dinochytrium kinnereticum]
MVNLLRHSPMKEITLTKKASDLYLGLPRVVQRMVTKKLRPKNIALKVAQPWDSDIKRPRNGTNVEIKLNFLKPLLSVMSGERKQKVFDFFAEMRRNMNITLGWDVVFLHN